jgi:hypothetical protein
MRQAQKTPWRSVLLARSLVSRVQREDNNAMIQDDANAFGAIASPGAAC